MNNIKVTFPQEFDKDQLEAMAQVLNMHIVYDCPNHYELVPRSSPCNITSIRHARIEAIKKRIAEREATKPDFKPMNLENVYPLPAKPKKSFFAKLFPKKRKFISQRAAQC